KQTKTRVRVCRLPERLHIFSTSPQGFADGNPETAGSGLTGVVLPHNFSESCQIPRDFLWMKIPPKRISIRFHWRESHLLSVFVHPSSQTCCPKSDIRGA